MRRAVCPGSFDPIHNGHLEVIARAAGLFDEVIVGVSTNYAKKYRFTLEERIDMARETLASLRGIVVEPVGDGLLDGSGRCVVTRATRRSELTLPVHWTLSRRLEYGDTTVLILREA